MIFSVPAGAHEAPGVCTNHLLRVATRSGFCVRSKDGDSEVHRERRGDGSCCGMVGDRGCKCRAANRLYVLSLTPERRREKKYCLDTYRGIFFVHTEVFLLRQGTRAAGFGRIRLVVKVIRCFKQIFFCS